MLFQKNASLKPYNTFGLDVKAKELYTVLQQSDLIELKNKGVFEQKHLILGGGSNVLLTSDFNGTVVLIKTQGKKKINTQTENLVEVEFAAGEVWHQCVMWAIENNYGGLENLSLIPGTTGAAPMQNIGAYGVEIKDTFMSLSAFNKATGKFETFNNAACEFGYRESIFKHRLKNQYIICNVRFGLTIGNHNLNTSYGAIANVLNQKGIINPSIQNISEAVIEIRQSKLPDPKQIGNSGSFFKNPIVQKSV
ncbi:MAG: UDP-N-acetylmuramate dehydrogenase, partial [Bacteroidia bacterium]